MLAARLEGPLKSAFPDGAPTNEGREAPVDAALAASHLASTENASLVLVGDVDILSDRLWVQAQNFLGQRLVTAFASNGDFVVNAPLVLGHEAAGTIVGVGESVDPSRIGQRVSIEPQRPDPDSAETRRGDYNLCPHMRFFGTPPIDGALCDYVTIGAAFAHPVPDTVSDDAAALCEPLLVGIAALRKAGIGEGAKLLVGQHDFTTFRSVHCQSASPVKTLDSLTVERLGQEIHIRAAARSFLHHQVRSMVGCLGLVGRGNWTVHQLGDALEAKDRQALGLNAPPEGLYFVEAIYPEDNPSN